MEILSWILLFFKNWWWIILPAILSFPLKALYLWWIRWEIWYKKRKWILLKIKPPKEILRPFMAMEDIFSVLWGVYDFPNWRERWCEGEPTRGPFWISFEIAGIGGEIHFFIRILQEWRGMVESAIYSQYPDAEISVVEDYTKNVPQTIPNQEWGLYGEDFTFMKDDPYPIKTYPMFFEERPELKEEEKIDPLYPLLEALAQLKPAEQFWLQIVAAPITNKDIPWRTKGRKIADKIARRKEKPKPMFLEGLISLFGEMGDFLIRGKPMEEVPAKVPEEKEIFPPEMKLTPGEREVLTAIEHKISKHGFETWIRIIYLYKRNEPYSFGNYKIGRSYFNQFMTEHLNTMKYWGATRAKIHYWFRERRLYLRERKMFRNYIERSSPLFPLSRERGTMILNAEELATIYHFPSKVIIPTLPSVEAKKAGPPSGLPTE